MTAFGVLGLFACVTAAALSLPSRHSAQKVTVRRLLVNPELADVLTQNLMKVNSHLAKEGRGAVHAVVTKRLHEVSDQLPYSSVLIPRAEETAMLQSVRKLGDSRMVGINKAIIEAVRDGVNKHASRDEVKRQLVEKLQTHRADMVQLYEDMVPKILRGEGRDGASRAAEVNPEKMTIMKEFDAMLAGTRLAKDGRRLLAKTTSQAINSQLSVLFSLINRKHHAKFELASAAPRDLTEVAFPAIPASEIVAWTTAPPYAVAAAGVDTALPYSFDCEPTPQATCRTYESCMDCIVGELGEGSVMDAVTCVTNGFENGFEAIQSMFKDMLGEGITFLTGNIVGKLLH